MAVNDQGNSGQPGLIRVTDSGMIPEMNRNYRNMVCRLATAGLALVLLVNTAHAYLDPGTGSYIVQLLIGGLLGGLFAIGLFWKKSLAFVKRLFSGKKHDLPGE